MVQSWTNFPYPWETYTEEALDGFLPSVSAFSYSKSLVVHAVSLLHNQLTILELISLANMGSILPNGYQLPTITTQHPVNERRAE